MFKSYKKLLLLSVAISFVSAIVLFGLPNISSPYSLSDLYTRIEAIFKAIPSSASSTTGKLVGDQIDGVIKLAAAEAKAPKGSRVSSEAIETGFFGSGTEYQLVEIMKAVDKLFNTNKAIQNKASAARVASFIGSYASRAATKHESTSVESEQYYWLMRQIFNTFYIGISMDWTLDHEYDEVAENLLQEVARQRERITYSFWNSPTAYSSSSSSSYSNSQSATSLSGIDRCKTGASASELIGVYDNNNICHVCKHSFEWGPMTAPFACGTKVHLAHPRCISGVTKCPVFGCGAGLGGVSSALQEDCVICCDSLFGNYKEVIAMFICAETNRLSSTRTHLLHEKCAKDLFKSDSQAKCPECRASQGKGIRRSPLIN